jgi:hypothetical protein
MDIKILLFITLAIILIVLYFVFQSKPVNKKVTIGNTEIEAEVADTLPKQIRGLMFRKSLAENNGMLFLFNNDDYYGIWMMNMSFPIDIIWIDSGHKIVDVVKNAQPCGIICSTYYPKEKARFVLEVNSGFTGKHSIKIGDVVEF